MKRMSWFVGVVILAVVVGWVAGITAAGKTYQFTGSVMSSDASGLTVKKSATETWTFSTDKDTKGTAKVGDKVTVSYTMVATQIEVKPATAAPAGGAAKTPAGGAAKKQPAPK